MRKAPAAALASLLLLAACTTRDPAARSRDPGEPVEVATPVPVVPAKVSDDERRVATGGNAFGLELYRQIVKTEKGNLFLSPNSISVALAMAAAGARGTTEAEMTDVLHLPADRNATQAGFSALLGRLHAERPGRPYVLRAANALWVQKQQGLAPDYVALVARSFGGAPHEVDFIAATEASRGEINSWVAAKTEQRIKDLLQPGVLTSDTRVVLTNAIYFKGEWEHEFEPDATRPGDFHATRADVKTSFMNQTRHLGYVHAEADGLALVELPYRGNELSMIVLLPDDRDGLHALESRLTAEAVDRWLGALGMPEVALSLPRFKMTKELTLNAPLVALGMESAFGEGADFRGMGGSGDFSISAVVHKAFVEVNEEGTEAAAATGVVIGTTSMPPPPVPFRADHPFLFLIREKNTGAILFLGRVEDPS